MGRPDAAGREEIGVAGAQPVHGLDDLLHFVGHHADLFQVDADIGEIFGDIADVLVLGAARQDLVSDDEKGGGDIRLGHVRLPLRQGLGRGTPPRKEKGLGAH